MFESSQETLKEKITLNEIINEYSSVLGYKANIEDRKTNLLRIIIFSIHLWYEMTNKNVYK